MKKLVLIILMMFLLCMRMAALSPNLSPTRLYSFADAEIREPISPVIHHAQQRALKLDLLRTHRVRRKCLRVDR